MIDEPLELRRCVISLQIDPADDTDHEWVIVSQFEQPPRFFNRLPRLHGHTCIYGSDIHFSPQLRRQKIASQRGHRIVYPAVLGGCVPPEVLMGINSHDARIGRFVDLQIGRFRNLTVCESRNLPIYT
jgi:hypothetical protein